MNINCLSVTFWFNIYDEHLNFLETLRNTLKDEYQNFNINSKTNNLLMPIITAISNEKKTNLTMSQINLQYNMDNVSWEDFPSFKETVLNIFEILQEKSVEVMHTALFINGEFIENAALEKLTNSILNENLNNNDLVDASIKIGKKEEDLFYKVITILNKKQIKLPKKVDNLGRVIPIPLISWNGSLIENEIIEVSYELNDKYSFDFTKNYHTTEFYLNKMLYLLENNYHSDIQNLIENGKIN